MANESKSISPSCSPGQDHVVFLCRTLNTLVVQLILILRDNHVVDKHPAQREMEILLGPPQMRKLHVG